jgi:hypothetical protein
MTPIPQEPSSKKEYWQNELDSLGVDTTKRPSELNDKDELEALADVIKQVYHQDYKTAYDYNNSSSSSSSSSDQTDRSKCQYTDA